jgi:NAD(P)-dependent dehydrogenase (short-subunit alcohol dehydrogenase family)
MDIQGSVALVTGGASGLGEAVVRRLVQGGARAVVAVDLNAERGEALAGELGDQVAFRRADVTDGEALAQVVGEAASKGPLRIGVACAGVGPPARIVDKQGVPAPLDWFEKTVKVNLVGTFNTLRLCAAAMVKNDPNDDGERGVVVQTASVAAYEGQIGQAAYSASKGGVVGMTLPSARDLASVGVRVNTIAPGIFDTPLLAGLGEEIRASLGAGVPFPKRMGSPTEYAELAAFIIGAPYLNGETIRLDGALRMPPR